MRKLLTGLSVVASMALLASAAQAECFGHNVTADVQSEPEVVAMSTAESTPPIVEEPATDAALTAECPEGATDCTQAGE